MTFKFETKQMDQVVRSVKSYELNPNKTNAKKIVNAVKNYGCALSFLSFRELDIVTKATESLF